MKRDLEFERIYPHPPELVWFAITDRDALAEWLMPNDFKPEVGHSFEFRTKPAPGFDGIVRCRVLEVEPPTRLSYTWVGSMINTVLTFNLEAVPGGTRLHLKQTGYSGVRAVLVSQIMKRGFTEMLDTRIPNLLDRLQRDKS